MNPRRLAPAALLAGCLALAFAGIALGGGAPAEALASGWRGALAVAALVGVAAAHRPHGGALLAFGALGIAAGIESAGATATAAGTLAGALLAELLHRRLGRRRDGPRPERRGWTRALERGALAALGALAAGGVWWRAGGEGVAALAAAGPLAALAALLPAIVFELGYRRWARRESWRRGFAALLPFGFDLAGFALGLIAVAVRRAGGAELGGATCAAFALLALEAARQHSRAEATGRTLAEAEKLHRAGASLAAESAELARLARRIFGECAAIAPYLHASLELASPESGEVRYSAAADGLPQSGDPDPPAWPPALPGFHRREAWRVLDHELFGEGERRARLRLWCDPRQIEPSTEGALEALVPQMAAAVRAAFLDREATTDRLTGAGTRRALERRLAAAFDRARDEGETLAVVICDLDHFKKINDKYGHPAGDEALRAVARVLVAANRGGEFCARFGGEEFVLVLEQTSGEIALEIAERLRRRIEEIELEAGGGRHTLTMSFGVAAFPELPVRGPEELVELADGALYTAKRLGRNLCVLDLGGGRMRTGGGDVVEVSEAPPPRTPVFFA